MIEFQVLSTACMNNRDSYR